MEEEMATHSSILAWRILWMAEPSGLLSTGSHRVGHDWRALACMHVFSSVQSLSRVRLFATPWIAACQASLSITNSGNSLRLTSIESVMPSSHLILCRPLLLLPPIPPSIRVFSNESALHMRWPKYWSFSFSIIPSMATHSSILAWRIPGTEELSGLLSMGSHRVRHHWSTLAAAAAAGLSYNCL